MKNVRLFRNQVGVGFVGTPAGSMFMEERNVILKNFQRVTMGLRPGSGDLIGWKSFTIEPEHVGRQIAQFVSVEVKNATGKPSDDQLRWHDVVRCHGGLSMIVRSVEQALNEISR